MKKQAKGFSQDISNRHRITYLVRNTGITQCSADEQLLKAGKTYFLNKREKHMRGQNSGHKQQVKMQNNIQSKTGRMQGVRPNTSNA